jgi:hypothetical protein
MLTRRADFRPQSADPAALTAEVTWSTGADVERRDKVGPYLERLRMDPEAVDLSRLVGGPLLDGHRQGGTADVLGAVVDAAVDGRQGTATVRFSPRHKTIFDDVAAGILRSISVGYHVSQWTAANESGTRVRIATRWQPLELSLVPIGADAGATIRGASPMSETETTETADRSAVDLEIRRLCQLGGADPEPLITLGASVEDARKASLAALVERGQSIETRPAVTVVRDYEDPAERASAYADAIMTRINPTHTPSDRARQFVGMSIRDLAADALRHAGIRMTTFAADPIISRALHTTSDFPLIMGDVVGKTLRAAYATQPSGVRSLARTVSVADFRAKAFLQFGDHLALEQVNEAGEFKSGTIGEAQGESVKVATYGKIFGYTRQLMVNDDLGALQRIGTIASTSARQMEADLCVDLLAGPAGVGPLLADGVRLFATGHGNLKSPGASPLTNIAAAVLAMRKQTGISGKLIDVQPSAVLIPAALEHECGQFFSSAYSPVTSDKVNPYAGLRVVVDPRLDAKSAKRWYLIAEGIEGLVVANLEGNAAPVVETRGGFKVDGVQLRVRHDFGCAFLDWRGWYADAGQ